METEKLLLKILNAEKPEAIFSPANYRKEFLAYQKLLHPDICQLPGAEEAAVKLNLFRQQMEAGNQITDDIGIFKQTDDKTLIFKGDTEMLQRSLGNYRKLMQLKDEASEHFKKYLPSQIIFSDGKLTLQNHEKIIPLHDLILPQHHVTWLTSRMLEFTTWLHQTGYVHGGINPESVCVVPESHGAVFTSFYHLQPLDSQLKTLSARYIDWYPNVVFDLKKAIPYVDLSLVQRTALYLLGDRSGNGIKLKKTHNEALIDFLIMPHYDAYTAFDQYRQLLKEQFGKPKFYEFPD
jgi:hypothetical protein